MDIWPHDVAGYLKKKMRGCKDGTQGFPDFCWRTCKMHFSGPLKEFTNLNFKKIIFQRLLFLNLDVKVTPQ